MAAGQQPVIQSQLERMGHLTREVDKMLSVLDESLDRLSTRPPRPVGDEAGRNIPAPGEAVRPSVEAALNAHINELERLRGDLQASLSRLHRAI